MTWRAPVPGALALGTLISLWSLPFVRFAPNRLLTGDGLAWWRAPLGLGHWAALLPCGLLLLAWRAQSRATRVVGLPAAALWLVALPWLAGMAARQMAPEVDGLARVSLGAGFWVSWGLMALLLGELLREAAWPVWRRVLLWVGV
ncbi:MAG: hypothetical protein JO171_14890, partial [Paludibacterium sp.]|nr:hypothetical protein [Paludibacterium sp.]